MQTVNSTLVHPQVFAVVSLLISGSAILTVVYSYKPFHVYCLPELTLDLIPLHICCQKIFYDEM